MTFEPKREGHIRPGRSLADFAGPLLIATVVAAGLGALADATGPSERAIQATVAGLVALVIVVTGRVSGRLPSNPFWIVGTGTAVGLLGLAVDRMGGGDVRAAATPILGWAAVALAVLSVPRVPTEGDAPGFLIAHVDAGAFAGAGTVLGLISLIPGIGSAGLDSFVRAAPLGAVCFLLASSNNGVRSRGGMVAVGVVTGVLAIAVELSTDVGGGRGVWLDASAGALFVLAASARTRGISPIGVAAGAAALAAVAGASIFTLVIVAVAVGIVMRMFLPGVLGDHEAEPDAQPRIIRLPTAPIATESTTARSSGASPTSLSAGAERTSPFTFDLWREMGVEAPTEIAVDDDVVSEFTRARDLPTEGPSR